MNAGFTELSNLRIEPSCYAGQSDQIIAEALNNLGWDLGSFLRCLGKPPETTLADFTSDRLSAIEWFAICRVLYLSADCFSYGYSRREHRARVREAVRGGHFHFSKRECARNPALRTFIGEIQVEQPVPAIQTGLRLRWKLRFQELLDGLIQRRSQSSLCDFVEARTAGIPTRLRGRKR